MAGGRQRYWFERLNQEADHDIGSSSGDAPARRARNFYSCYRPRPAADRAAGEPLADPDVPVSAVQHAVGLAQADAPCRRLLLCRQIQLRLHALLVPVLAAARSD